MDQTTADQEILKEVEEALDYDIKEGYLSKLLVEFNNTDRIRKELYEIKIDERNEHLKESMSTLTTITVTEETYTNDNISYFLYSIYFLSV